MAMRNMELRRHVSQQIVAAMQLHGGACSDCMHAIDVYSLAAINVRTCSVVFVTKRSRDLAAMNTHRGDHTNVVCLSCRTYF